MECVFGRLSVIPLTGVLCPPARRVCRPAATTSNSSKHYQPVAMGEARLDRPQPEQVAVACQA